AASRYLSVAIVLTSITFSSRALAQGEEKISDDLARLMPADTLVYAEVAHPGDQAERLIKMLGLIREPGAQTQAGGISLGNGLFFPNDFTVSPALVAELKKCGGVAMAMTGLDSHGQPEGLVALHTGNCDLLRGILETTVQVLEPGDPIEGFK